MIESAWGLLERPGRMSDGFIVDQQRPALWHIAGGEPEYPLLLSVGMTLGNLKVQGLHAVVPLGMVFSSHRNAWLHPHIARVRGSGAPPPAAPLGTRPVVSQIRQAHLPAWSRMPPRAKVRVHRTGPSDASGLHQLCCIFRQGL